MSSLWHFVQYNYAPVHGPFYQGAVWANVFVVVVLAPLGWVWARTKFWPLKPIRHAVAVVDRELGEHRRLAREHNEWSARQIAVMHKHVTGRPAEAHPHFDVGGQE